MKSLRFALLAALTISALTTLGQVKIEGYDSHWRDRHEPTKSRFWAAPELTVSLGQSGPGGRTLPTELTGVFGYRFSDYLRIGAGIGARMYLYNSKTRYKDSKFSFPLYANVRGNFIPSRGHECVPYYSLDAGVALGDGPMVRPMLGLRFGQERSCFLFGVGYTGQSLLSYTGTGANRVSKRRFMSFVSVRFGYEF